MRVTDLTKQNGVIRSIMRNSENLSNIQNNMATGKRIAKLSDDPVGATQVQDFRTKISFFDTLQRNINNNFIWLDRTESELASIGDALRRAKVLMLSQANASGDAATRKVTAEELQAITDSIFNSGNSKSGKLYIFSGSKTLTKPLTRNTTVHPATVKLNDQEGITEQAIFEGNSSNHYILKITKPGPVGRAHYVVSDDGGKTWSREKTFLAQVELVNEEGKPSDKVTLRMTSLEPPEGQKELVFPTGMEFSLKPSPPVVFHGNDDHRMVETGEGILLPLNVTGGELFFKTDHDPDSINIFNLLYGLKRALMDNDQHAIERRLDEIDAASEQVLQNRANIGAVRKEMDDRMEKLNAREFSKMENLSELEDLDFAKAVVDMNIADARHKAALDTSSRLLQPSLLNFLR